MVRVSNGFQLTLERDNVFFDYYKTPPPADAPGPGAAPAATSVDTLTDDECWARMPRAVEGGGGPLPAWAKAVAVHLPRTAAAMLELDLAQRTRGPLDPALRAKMRWVIARANRCTYSEAYSLADLRRAGGDEEATRALTGDPAGWPEVDREPLELARQLTVSASTLPDDLFARLRDRFGAEGVAAMVLLGAYGNFQDRVALGLGLAVEPGGPLPPLPVRFAPGSFQAVPLLPPQSEAPRLNPSGETVVGRDPEWSELSYEELQSRLEAQRGRTPRLPIPSWDEVRRRLPPEMAARPTRIVWNLVGFGYVPELAVPWSVATRTMWAEAQNDRVFEESLFWVQTRAIRCNYCMGHCEMLLEVAGLDPEAVAERTRAGRRRLVGLPAGRAAGLRLRPHADEGPLGADAGRLRDAPERPRPRAGPGDVLVALPRPVHDARLRRLRPAAGARKRLPRLRRNPGAGPARRRGEMTPGAGVDPTRAHLEH